MDDEVVQKLRHLSTGLLERLRDVVRYVSEQIELSPPVDLDASITVSKEMAGKRGFFYEEVHPLLNTINRSLGENVLTVEQEFIPDLSFDGYIEGSRSMKDEKPFLIFSVPDITKLARIKSFLDFADQKEVSPRGEEVLIRLPPSTMWEDVTIQFIDRENVRIIAPNDFLQEASYKEMGFQNKKTVPRRPNKQWLLLESLSELGGRITWGDRPANPTLKKTKQLLSDGLQACFGISSDPFRPYKVEDAYEIKIGLISSVGEARIREQRIREPRDLDFGKEEGEEEDDKYGIQDELDRYGS